MDKPILIKDDIYWIGVNDHQTHLFEAIWPLPQGVCYNAYAIIDEKIALIDTVKGAFTRQYLDKVATLLNGRKPDYLIINHMEPDHSGALSTLLEIYPDISIVGNKKTLEILGNFYGAFVHTMAVDDGAALSLGRQTLRFHLIPMVHWPETMVTYVTGPKVLFSGDAFGGFGALNGGIFDDEVDLDYFENETLRYYSNIVGKYSAMTQKALQKLSGLEIDVIAATHGPIYRKDPAYIVRQYDRWSRYETEPGVVIAYASMYGNTEKMAEAVARSVAEHGVCCVRLHNVSTTHLSYLITDIWRFKAVVLGSCTYNTRLFPLMDQLVRNLDPKMMQTRVVGLFGSYTWSGGAMKELKELAEKGNWNLVEPGIEFKSAPKKGDLELAGELGRKVAERVKGE